MFQYYKIEVDDQKFRNEIGEFGKKMPQVARRMMGKLSTEIRKTSRKDYLKGGSLNKQSGNLSKKISYKTKPDYTAIIIASAGYASTHEKGKTISPKKGTYLTFKLGDQWIKIKSVTVPARPFLKPVIDDYFTTGKAEQIMDLILQQQLAKFFSK